MLLKFCTALLLGTISKVGVQALMDGDSYDDPSLLLQTNAVSGYSEAKEVDTHVLGNCVDGQPPVTEPDAQTTKYDEVCRELGNCHIAFTQPREYVVYDFDHLEQHFSGSYYDDCPQLIVDITLRVASRAPKSLFMEVYDDGHELGPVSPSFTTQGLGFQTFEDITWSNVELSPYNPHRLFIYFTEGQVNLCSVTVRAVGVDNVFGLPFAVNALDYTDHYEIDKEILGNCEAGNPPGGIDAPDAQTTEDSVCRELGPCHVAFAQPTEWVEYAFRHTDEDVVDVRQGRKRSVFVDITIRVASAEKKIVQIELKDGEQIGPDRRFEAPAKGYQTFEDITWRMVELRADEPLHTVLIFFLEGNVNLCSVSVTRSLQTPPIIWGALDYFTFHEKSPEKFGNCETGNSLDAQPTSDEICINRDNSECNIGWTERFENLRYYFYIPDDDDFDIWIRIAANAPGRKVRLVLNPAGEDGYGEIFEVVSGGWQNFKDLVWELLYLEENYYELVVGFDDEGINFCSIAVKPSTSRYAVYVPGTYSALFYADFRSQNNPERLGDCPDGRPMDAQLTEDEVCGQALSEKNYACNLGWTQPGDFVSYQFETDGSRQYVNLSFRIAGPQRSKYIDVELYVGNNKVSKRFHAPGRGWQTYETRVWENVYLSSNTFHEMLVKFTTGKVNLCTFGVEYADH